MNTKKLLTSVAVAAALSTAGVASAELSTDSNAPTIISAIGSYDADEIRVDLTKAGTGGANVALSSAYYFTLSSDFSTSYTIDTLVRSKSDGSSASFSPFSAILYSIGNSGALTAIAASGSASYAGLSAGKYELLLSGSASNTYSKAQSIFYTPTLNVTAVPEPESYAMLLAGLGLMGTIARRRSKAKAS